MASCGKCLNALKTITVEPIIFLTMVSMQMCMIVQETGLYEVICKQMYFDHPEIDCTNKKQLSNTSVNGQLVEDQVQKKMTMWKIALGLAYMAPSLIAEIFLGACGDRYGRKVNILLGMVGLMISAYPLIIIFTYPLTTPLYVLVIAHLITGFTGFMFICIISSFAYLADTVLLPEQLTVRMAIMAVAMNIGGIIGSLLGGAMARFLTQQQTVLVGQAVLVLAFFFCLVRIRQVPPLILRRRLMEKYELEHGKKPDFDTSKLPPAAMAMTAVSHANEKKSICNFVMELLKETWHTYARPRPGNQRLYILVVSLVFFLNTISELGIRVNVFSSYAQKAPLAWGQETIGFFRSANQAMHCAGMVFGILVLKKWLGFTDTFIILIASLSHIAECLMYTFTNSTGMAYAAAAVGSLAPLVMPCIQSFLAKLVEPHEVGKAYTAFGISANIGMMISSVLYNAIYYATVTFWPGFVFLFAAGILTMAFFAVLWLHVDSSFSKQSNESFKQKFARSIFSTKSRDAPTIGTAKVTPIDVIPVPEKMEMHQA